MPLLGSFLTGALSALLARRIAWRVYEVRLSYGSALVGFAVGFALAGLSADLIESTFDALWPQHPGFAWTMFWAFTWIVALGLVIGSFAALARGLDRTRLGRANGVIVGVLSLIALVPLSFVFWIVYVGFFVSRAPVQ